MIASIEATSSVAASWAAAGLFAQPMARTATARRRIVFIRNLSNRGQSGLNFSHENERASPPNLEIHDYRPVIRSDRFVHQPLIQHRETVSRIEENEIDLPNRVE